MLKYLLAYEFGAMFPRLTLGILLLVVGLIVWFLAESAINYHLHPYHYEKRGNGWVEVPGRMKGPVEKRNPTVRPAGSMNNGRRA